MRPRSWISSTSCGVGDRRAPLLQVALGLLQRLLQALGPHRLGQVVDGLELEGRDRVGRIGGDEHHRRRCRPAAQPARQLEAVDARHVDVEQHQVEARAGQLVGAPSPCAASATTSAGGDWQSASKRAQARARQRFVVDDQGAKGCSDMLMVRQESAMRTR